MSSLFPCLRSLLISPHKRDPQRVPIKETIKDRDRGGFTTPDRQQDHLSFHDTGLRGAQGALIVLEALATNPFASKLTLSHNSLGDSGVRQLTSRIKFLKNRRTVDIHELNLASNSLTDTSLVDLCKSWNGLTELYLSNNKIKLESNDHSSIQSSHPTPILNLGNLTLLSLTSNPIDRQSISNLFRNPNFIPSELTTLHLSACSLDLPVAISLALWLEDKSRSGKLEWLAVNGNDWGKSGCERITWALARKGGNSNLLRVEMLACDGPPSRAATRNEESMNQVNDMIQIDGLEESAGSESIDRTMGFRDLRDLEDCRLAIKLEGGWKSLLEKCEARNQALRLAARRAALGLVSSARQILLSSPGVGIKKQNEEETRNVFPWNRLPEEIKLNIWRWVSILSAFPGLQDYHHYQLSLEEDRSIQVERPLTTHSTVIYDDLSSHSSLEIPNSNITNRSQGVGHSSLSSFGNQQVKRCNYSKEVVSYERYNLPDPLTLKQLIKTIEYASDRNSLLEEIEQRDQLIFSHQLNHSVLHSNPINPTHPSDHYDDRFNNHQIPISLHRRLIDTHRIENELDRLGRSLILKSCGCLRFEGCI